PTDRQALLYVARRVLPQAAETTESTAAQRLANPHRPPEHAPRVHATRSSPPWRRGGSQEQGAPPQRSDEGQGHAARRFAVHSPRTQAVQARIEQAASHPPRSARQVALQAAVSTHTRQAIAPA